MGGRKAVFQTGRRRQDLGSGDSFWIMEKKMETV